MGCPEDMLRLQGLVWANGDENYLSNKEKRAIGFPRDQEAWEVKAWEFLVSTVFIHEGIFQWSSAL